MSGTDTNKTGTDTNICQGQTQTYVRDRHKHMSEIPTLFVVLKVTTVVSEKLKIKPPNMN